MIRADPGGGFRGVAPPGQLSLPAEPGGGFRGVVPPGQLSLPAEPGGGFRGVVPPGQQGCPRAAAARAGAGQAIAGPGKQLARRREHNSPNTAITARPSGG
jgi:hypothetical protein